MRKYTFRDDDFEHEYESDVGIDWAQVAWGMICGLGIIVPIGAALGYVFDLW
jgi:hypothetical protein